MKKKFYVFEHANEKVLFYGFVLYCIIHLIFLYKLNTIVDTSNFSYSRARFYNTIKSFYLDIPLYGGFMYIYYRNIYKNGFYSFKDFISLILYTLYIYITYRVLLYNDNTLNRYGNYFIAEYPELYDYNAVVINRKLKEFKSTIIFYLYFLYFYFHILFYLSFELYEEEEEYLPL